MKTKILTKTRNILISAIIFCSINVAAQDKITFTWQINERLQEGEAYLAPLFRLISTIDEPLTINWGDGIIETKICESNLHGIVPTHYYDTMGKYTVTITASSVNCKFEDFSAEYGFVQSLDVSNCSVLTILTCEHNQIEHLAVCPSLTYLNCIGNRLTYLDLSNCNTLSSARCSYNQITNLNLSGCIALKRLKCQYNQLTSLDLAECPALEELDCAENQLTNLDVTECPYLNHLDCYNNQLINLSLINSLPLKQLFCGDNKLTNLDLSGFQVLEGLECVNNQLINLDLSNCSALRLLWCYQNQLTSLNLSGCIALSNLWCYKNQLSNLDLTECLALMSIYCYDNRLQLSDLYSADLLIDYPISKRLGSQNLAPQMAIIGEELFSGQSMFDGIFTEYIVTKGGSPAPESDYSIEDGKLTFNALGEYTVTMTNDAIAPNVYYPAEVIVPISVWPVGIPENDVAGIKAYPNPTIGKLSVETRGRASEKIELFDISGEKVFETKETNFDISFLPAGTYFLRINEKTIKIIKQ